MCPDIVGDIFLLRTENHYNLSQGNAKDLKYYSLELKKKYHSTSLEILLAYVHF